MHLHFYLLILVSVSCPYKYNLFNFIHVCTETMYDKSINSILKRLGNDFFCAIMTHCVVCFVFWCCLAFLHIPCIISCCPLKIIENRFGRERTCTNLLGEPRRRPQVNFSRKRKTHPEIWLRVARIPLSHSLSVFPLSALSASFNVHNKT